MSRKRKHFILAIDSLSGLTAGTVTWVLAPLLTLHHAWTMEFARFIASANVGYGIFSGTVFLVFKRNVQGPIWPVAALIAGNCVWAIQCFLQAWRLRFESSYTGIAHLAMEGAYVGILAYFEARIFLFAKDSYRAEG